MNKARREKLQNAISHLNMALDIVESVKSEEEDVMYNIPENLQGSERYAKSEESCDNMESACESIEDAVISINNIMGW